MRLSDRGAALLEEFEGFRSHPYRDSVGVATIGFGSTKGVTMSTPPVTRAQARARMKREIDATYGAAVNRARSDWTQNEYDALTSFVYNLGPGSLSPEWSIGRAVRAGNRRAIADAMLLYDKAGGRRLAGLTRRRQAERALFLTAPTDGLAHLTPIEARRCRELDRLRREKRDLPRRRVLERVLTESRKRVWRAAQGPGGWGHANRAKRYASLKARTT